MNGFRPIKELPDDPPIDDTGFLDELKAKANSDEMKKLIQLAFEHGYDQGECTAQLEAFDKFGIKLN